VIVGVAVGISARGLKMKDSVLAIIFFCDEVVATNAAISDLYAA